MTSKTKRGRELVASDDEEYGTQDKIKQVQRTIQDAKLSVNQAISNAIDRGDNLESLNDKAQNLQELGLDFNREAKRVRRRMWCQNIKVTILLFTIIFIIALILYFLLIHPLITK